MMHEHHHPRDQGATVQFQSTFQWLFTPVKCGKWRPKPSSTLIRSNNYAWDAFWKSRIEIGWPIKKCIVHHPLSSTRDVTVWKFLITIIVTKIITVISIFHGIVQMCWRCSKITDTINSPSFIFKYQQKTQITFCLHNHNNITNDVRIFKVQGFFICHIINYTGYNQKWNVDQIRSAQWTVQRITII